MKPEDVTRLCELLEHDKTVYDKILIHAKEQMNCMLEGNHDKLFATLRALKSLIEERETYNDELTSLQEVFQENKDSIFPALAQRVVDAQDAIQSVLEDIVAQENIAQQQAQKQQDDGTKKAAHLAKGRQMNKAYGNLNRQRKGPSPSEGMMDTEK